MFKKSSTQPISCARLSKIPATKKLKKKASTESCFGNINRLAALEQAVAKGFKDVNERFDKTDKRIDNLGIELAELSGDELTIDHRSGLIRSTWAFSTSPFGVKYPSNKSLSILLLLLLPK